MTVVVGSLVGWNPDHEISEHFDSDGRYLVTEVMYSIGHGPTHVKAVSVDDNETVITAILPCCRAQGVDPIVVHVGLLC